MFGLKRKPKRFKGVDRKVSNAPELLADYEAAEETGRVRLGALFLYYRDLGRFYNVPYEYIDRAFCRVSEAHPDDSPAYYYYRLILVHGEKEFANLIFDKEEQVDSLLEKLQARNSAMKLGYVPPADGVRRHFS